MFVFGLGRPHFLYFLFLNILKSFSLFLILIKFFIAPQTSRNPAIYEVKKKKLSCVETGLYIYRIFNENYQNAILLSSFFFCVFVFRNHILYCRLYEAPRNIRIICFQFLVASLALWVSFFLLL